MESLTGLNALTLLFTTLCVFAIGYRIYGVFVASRVMRLSNDNVTPAVKLADGRDFVATNKNVLFGHQFAAISAAGPLVGPVLAAQFGFLPGALWILIGCVLAGAVHDSIALFASVRHRAQGLANIARAEIDPVTGNVAGLAIMFILILSLATLSVVMVNALMASPWSLFIVACTIPIAIVMGLLMRSKGIVLASVIGVALLVFCIIFGHTLNEPGSTLGAMFNWSKSELSIGVPVYGFIAAVLPVWLLLVPRDYLSTYLKIGTVAMLAIGIVFVRPEMLMPPLTKFIAGGGPNVGGPVLPFIFVTIACGAISGFHSVISTGTTPKMISKEKEILFVGYGAMLTEGFVAIMALIAACTLVPGDYFAINVSKDLYPAFLAANPEFAQQDLAEMSKLIGIEVAGRPGGAVSLAVGMAHIFRQVPGMDALMGYWYNFAVMFEAVFILTAIDAGTRVGRFFMADLIGIVIPKFKDRNWSLGSNLAAAIFTFCWGYLAYTGTIASIWALFGMSNQLLASCALIICTTMLIRMNRGYLALVTMVPGLFMAFIVFWVGRIQIFNIYIPKQQYLLATIGILVLAMVLFVFIGAFRKWIKLSGIKTTVKDAFGEQVKELAGDAAKS
jgi:carbon starvation protein